MKPREFLTYLQAVDASRREPQQQVLTASLDDIKAVFSPFIGHSILERLRNEFPQLVDDVGEAQLHDIVQRVMGGKDVGAIMDIQAPSEIFEEFLQALSPTLTECDLTPEAVRELIAIGLRDTHEPNARARLVPGHGGFVIEVNAGMWWIISAFARVISLSWSAKSSNTPMLDAKSRDSLFMRLITLYAEYAEAPQLLREVAFVHLKDYYQDALAQRLSKHTKQFVVAHELAHIMSGHLSKSKDRAPQLALDSQEPLPTAWEEEHEADCFGVSLILQVQNTSRDRERDLLWGYIGADAFFGILNVIENVLRLPATLSHPPAIKRREKLRRHLRENFPGAVEAFFGRAEPFGELLDDLAVRLGAS